MIDGLSEPYAILSLDAVGDLVADMVGQDELVTAAATELPEAVLLSGGGDQLGVGSLARALRRFKEGLPPATYLGDAFGANLRAVLDAYERLLEENDQDLYPWITARLKGGTAGPQAHAPMLDRIAAHAQSRLREIRGA